MQVLVVDDQERILEVIEKMVHWDNLNVEKVFTAGSAAEAKEILKSTKIDIMLTDIEMPGEDGISLQKWQSEVYPAVTCIFLTSHADFSYAKEAIHNGAFDYILQPASIPEIEKTVSRCIEHIEERRLLQLKSSQYDTRLSEILETHVFTMFHQKSHFHDMKDWKIDSHTCEDDWWYLPCLVEFPSTQKNRSLFSGAARKDADNTNTAPAVRLADLRKCMQQEIETTVEAEKIRIVTSCLDGTHIGALFYRQGLPSDCTALRERLGAALVKAGNDQNRESIVYVGECTNEELPEQIEALFSFCAGRILKENGVYLVEPFREVQLRKPDSSVWGRWLIRRDTVLVKNQIANLLRYAQGENGLTVNYIHELLHALLEACSIACFEQKIVIPDSIADQFSYEKLVQSCTTAELFRSTVDNVLRQYESLLPVEEGKENYSVRERIREVIHYLDENMDRMVSRREAAKFVFLSEDYFSRMFFRETGLRYKEYLIRHKMDYAAKLLVETDLPVTLIASKVGYENFTNFTKMFRKVMGMTPTDYRKGRKRTV